MTDPILETSIESNDEVTFDFDNTYAHELTGFYAPSQPEKSSKPKLVYFNQPLSMALGLTCLEPLETDRLAGIFSGNQLPQGAEPVAQVYAGHQFGHFSPQLGDGRALIVGELLDPRGERYDLALKGSGRTPFSRGGDGKAALGPMLREVLVGEAMHALGIASTRSLAVVATGEPVYREIVLPGAILTRVASSHIRIGTFEFFAARGEHHNIKKLADYTLRRHYPQPNDVEHPYRELLRGVVQVQAKLIAQWMSVGFIHGVLNTDNMSIAGETIDYGPCAFMESYNPKTVFSSIDHQGRYAYDNQPSIGQWNLAKFAQTLLPLLDRDEKKAIEIAGEILDQYGSIYEIHWLNLMSKKLGLPENLLNKNEEGRVVLDSWFKLLQDHQVDFTLAWRALADAAQGDDVNLRKRFRETTELEQWLHNWRQLSQGLSEFSTDQKRAEMMRSINPWVIPRNHHVEMALNTASDQGNMEPFQQLLLALRNPFVEKDQFAAFAEPASAEFTQEFKTYCGT
ncbi:MAG: hypothetical protein ACI82Z_000304 [Cellvibrionaceae bacterium]|jgi:uncharacterized protein YdiU (UPF0061 family)